MGYSVVTSAISRKGGRKKVIVIVVIVFQLLGLGSAVHAIMSSRTPQGSVAWAVSLLTIPYISVPAYWVFGRNKFNGYILARQDQLKALEDIIREANTQIANVTQDEPLNIGAITGAEKMARSPMTGSNRTTLLIDGKATFASIFDGIEAAED